MQRLVQCKKAAMQVWAAGRTTSSAPHHSCGLTAQTWRSGMRAQGVAPPARLLASDSAACPIFTRPLALGGDLADGVASEPLRLINFGSGGAATRLCTPVLFGRRSPCRIGRVMHRKRSLLVGGSLLLGCRGHGTGRLLISGPVRPVLTLENLLGSCTRGKSHAGGYHRKNGCGAQSMHGVEYGGWRPQAMGPDRKLQPCKIKQFATF